MDREPTVQLLTFELGSLPCALPTRVLVEVARAVAITPLPKAPPIIEGLVNLRGAIVPVLDVRRRFGLEPRALTPDQHFLIAWSGPRVVALRVDRALDLVAVDEHAIDSAARAAPGAEHVAGIARLPDGLLVIYDLETLLGLEEGREVDGAVAEAAAAGERESNR